jgi:hypothetical protein
MFAFSSSPNVPRSYDATSSIFSTFMMLSLLGLRHFRMRQSACHYYISGSQTIQVITDIVPQGLPWRQLMVCGRRGWKSTSNESTNGGFGTANGQKRLSRYDKYQVYTSRVVLYWSIFMSGAVHHLIIIDTQSKSDHSHPERRISHNPIDCS